jgi:hypothetical protein
MKQLLQLGLSVDDAFDFTEAAKKVGTFNNIIGGPDGVSQSVQDFVKGLITGSAELLENLSPALRQVITRLGGYAKVAQDAATRQKLINIVIKQGNDLTSKYNEALKTGALQSAAFKNRTELLAKTVGDELRPAYDAVLGSLSGVVQGITDFIKNAASSTKTILAIAAGAATLATTLGTVGIAAKALGITLKAALVGTGVGAAIIGITAAAIALSEALAEDETQAELLREENEKQIKSIEKLEEKYISLARKTNLTKDEQQELAKVQDQLSGKVDGFSVDLDNNTTSLDKNTAAIEKRKRALKEQSTLAGIDSELIKKAVGLQVRLNDLRVAGTKEIGKLGALLITQNKDRSEAEKIELAIQSIVATTKTSRVAIKNLGDQITRKELQREEILRKIDDIEKSTGDKKAKAIQLLRDNLFLLDDWERQLFAIDSAFNQQILFLNQELQLTNDLTEQTELLRQVQETIHKRELLLTIQGLEKADMAAQGLANTLMNIKDRAIGGIIQGLGQIVSVFDSVLGKAVSVFGSIVSSLEDIVGLTKEEFDGATKLREQEEERLRVLKEEEKIRDEILENRRQEIELQASLNQAERDRRDIARDIRNTQLEINLLFAEGEKEKLELQKQSLKTELQISQRAGRLEHLDVTTEAGLEFALSAKAMDANDALLLDLISRQLSIITPESDMDTIGDVFTTIDSAISQMSLRFDKRGLEAISDQLKQVRSLMIERERTGDVVTMIAGVRTRSPLERIQDAFQEFEVGRGRIGQIEETLNNQIESVSTAIDTGIRLISNTETLQNLFQAEAAEMPMSGEQSSALQAGLEQTQQRIREQVQAGGFLRTDDLGFLETTFGTTEAEQLRQTIEQQRIDAGITTGFSTTSFPDVTSSVSSVPSISSAMSADSATLELKTQSSILREIRDLMAILVELNGNDTADDQAILLRFESLVSGTLSNLQERLVS